MLGRARRFPSLLPSRPFRPHLSSTSFSPDFDSFPSTESFELQKTIVTKLAKGAVRPSPSLLSSPPPFHLELTRLLLSTASCQHQTPKGRHLSYLQVCFRIHQLPRSVFSSSLCLHPQPIPVPPFEFAPSSPILVLCSLSSSSCHVRSPLYLPPYPSLLTSLKADLYHHLTRETNRTELTKELSVETSRPSLPRTFSKLSPTPTSTLQSCFLYFKLNWKVRLALSFFLSLFILASSQFNSSRASRLSFPSLPFLVPSPLLPRADPLLNLPTLHSFHVPLTFHPAFRGNNGAAPTRRRKSSVSEYPDVVEKKGGRKSDAEPARKGPVVKLRLNGNGNGKGKEREAPLGALAAEAGEFSLSPQVLLLSRRVLGWQEVASRVSRR